MKTINHQLGWFDNSKKGKQWPDDTVLERFVLNFTLQFYAKFMKDDETGD